MAFRVPVFGVWDSGLGVQGLEFKGLGWGSGSGFRVPEGLRS